MNEQKREQGTTCGAITAHGKDIHSTRNVDNIFSEKFKPSSSHVLEIFILEKDIHPPLTLEMQKAVNLVNQFVLFFPNLC